MLAPPDRLAAQIRTGRREVEGQTEAAEATVSRLVNDAGAWSVANLKQASSGADEDIRAPYLSEASISRRKIALIRDW